MRACKDGVEMLNKLLPGFTDLGQCGVKSRNKHSGDGVLGWVTCDMDD